MNATAWLLVAECRRAIYQLDQIESLITCEHGLAGLSMEELNLKQKELNDCIDALEAIAKATLTAQEKLPRGD